MEIVNSLSVNIINMLRKKLIGGVIALSMIAPFAASAATVTSNAVFDGQTQVYGNAGSSVQATFQIDVPAGQVLHAIRTKVDSQPTVCTSIGPVEGAQTTEVSVNITLPPNTNNVGYSFVADLFYTDTLPQAQAMTGDLACTSSVTGSHVNLGAYNNGTSVNVLPSSGSSTAGSSTSIQAQINALSASVAALVAAMSHPATPAPNTACAELNTKLVGTVDNSYNPANVRLQGFLLSEGASIPALASGASFGFKGDQTRAAVSWFNTMNNCH